MAGPMPQDSSIRTWLKAVVGTIAAGLVLAYISHNHANDSNRTARLAALERALGLVEQRQQNVMEHLQHLQTDRAVRGEALHQLDTRLTRLETQAPVQDQRIATIVERMLKMLENGTAWCRPLPP